MSYSSSDNFGKIINQGIDYILKAGFANDIIVYQPEWRRQDMTKGRYLRIYENGSSIEEQGAMYETRSYNYQISFYYQFSGDRTKKIYDDIISNEWNNYYYYFMGFRDYQDHPTHGYCWHNIQFTEVSEVVWGFEDEEPDVGHIDAEVSFFRTNEFENLNIALGGAGL